jgi:nitroreductase
MCNDDKSILDVLQWRYATKKFDATKKVLPGLLDMVLEAIRLAPTSFGLQSFRVAVVENPSKNSAILKAALNMDNVATASHLLVFCVDTRLKFHIDKYIQNMKDNNAPEQFIKRMKSIMPFFIFMKTLFIFKNQWLAKQAYIAMGVGLVAAAELEIDTCPIEAFVPGKLKRALGLPSHLKPAVIMALGYRASTEIPREKYRLCADELFMRV